MAASTIAEVRALESRRIIKGSVRAVRSGDKVTLSGHAAVYNQRSEWLGWFFEEIAPGTFARAIRGDDDVRFLIDHDAGRVLGRNKSGTLRLSDDSVGLAFSLDVPDTQEARDLVTLVERGDITQMSFGFYTLTDEWREEKREDKSTYYVRTLKEVELFDVSAVAFPAYPQTDIAKRRLELSQAQAKPPAIEAMASRSRRLRLAAASLNLAQG
ncbi:MAG TPA: HK97 family phage prohead protease [Phycisphaerales bacterium]|nr:HK97 family phage prohead protease [Phycisphaerales bacterium]